MSGIKYVTGKHRIQKIQNNTAENTDDKSYINDKDHCLHSDKLLLSRTSRTRVSRMWMSSAVDIERDRLNISGCLNYNILENVVKIKYTAPYDFWKLICVFCTLYRL